MRSFCARWHLVASSLAIFIRCGTKVAFLRRGGLYPPQLAARFGPNLFPLDFKPSDVDTYCITKYILVRALVCVCKRRLVHMHAVSTTKCAVHSLECKDYHYPDFHFVRRGHESSAETAVDVRLHVNPHPRPRREALRRIPQQPQRLKLIAGELCDTAGESHERHIPVAAARTVEEGKPRQTMQRFSAPAEPRQDRIFLLLVALEKHLGIQVEHFRSTPEWRTPLQIAGERAALFHDCSAQRSGAHMPCWSGIPLRNGLKVGLYDGIVL